MTAWFTMVNVTLTCWLFTVDPASVSTIVINPSTTPAVTWVIMGVTVIAMLPDGASVPRDGETGAMGAIFASSLIPQFKGALPVLEIVKLFGSGFCPWIALKARLFVVTASFATGGGLTINVTITGVAVAPA